MFKKLSPKTESEIINNWTHTDKVYASIVCPTYNQELYISDAIDSFLSQECKYKFEIIIHDDASTDNTPDILASYKKRFPSIIKLVSQKENQYSKGKQISRLASLHATGEFVALCEGDDYWISKTKLNQQIDCLLSNRHVDICFTPAVSLDQNGIQRKISFYGTEKKHFTASEVIRMGGAGIPTASILVNKEIIIGMSEWFEQAAPVGDYYIQVSGSKRNGALYLPLLSSCYRVESTGSWSQSRLTSNEEVIIRNMNNQNNAISECISEPEFAKDLCFIKSVNYYNACYELVMSKDYGQVSKVIEFSWKEYRKSHRLQIILYWLRYFPSALNRILTIHNKIKKRF